MADIKAGVVVVTRFCEASSKVFSSYIEYMDRNEATRNEHLSQYNLYNDYMDNPEKTSGLFSNTKIKLTQKDKQELKEVFQIAQEKESLMWQTVISFDNRWLEQYGIYNSETKVIDERKLKEVASGAINRMLKNEGLENAIWSGAIHFNTDNVHIHVATVEPVPQREKREYVKYQYFRDPKGNYIQDNYGKWIYVKDSTIEAMEAKGKLLETYRKEMVTQNGQPVKELKYKGVFKPKSIEMCKQHVVNEIMQQREQNILINRIIREQIVKQKQDMMLSHDPDLRTKFLQIYQELPRVGNRGLWKYNTNAMAKVRPLLDELSSMYIQKYHQKEYMELKELLHEQAQIYNTAYGVGKKEIRDYEQSKNKELYERLGNAILKEMVTYDRNIQSGIETINENDIEMVQEFTEQEQGVYVNDNDSEFISNSDNQQETLQQEELNPILETFESEQVIQSTVPDGDGNYVPGSKEYKLAWSGKYKAARNLIYNEHQYQEGFELLKEESLDGNVLATYEIGNLYKYGRGLKIDADTADIYFTKAFEMFRTIHEEQNTSYVAPYLEYRIGKMYYYGIGTEQNYEEAFSWLEQSKNKFADYILGNMYYSGQYVEVDVEKAIHYYKQSGTPYAHYQLGKIYENGIGTEPSQEHSFTYYQKALSQFLEIEAENPDDNIEYRIGMMYLKGKGTEVDENKAISFLEKSAELGNASAQHQMALIYLKDPECTSEKREEAINLLTESAIKGRNTRAQYVLGKLALEAEPLQLNEAIKWFTMASEKNDFAQYQLGKLYMNNSLETFDMEKGIYYMQMSADNNNQYAQHQLGKLYCNKEYEGYDLMTGISYLEKAAEVENEASINLLAKLYLDKTLNVYNQEKGVEYLERSAKKENSFAQYQLGKIYCDPEFAKYDLHKGVSFLEKAKENGNDLALYKLGKLYTNKDLDIYAPQKGIQYLEMSANKGNQYAQLALGMIYLQGENKYPGIKQDKNMAYKWLEKAAANGNEFAKEVMKSPEKYRMAMMAEQNIKTGKFYVRRSKYEMDRAMRALQKSFQNQTEKQRNLWEHEKLQEKEKERELNQEREQELEHDRNIH